MTKSVDMAMQTKRKPNHGAVGQREVGDRYGDSQRKHLYRRLAAAEPFGLFVLDGKLSFAAYPSPRCSGLQQDCPAGLVGIYTEMPTWAQLVEDLQDTEALLANLATASSA